MYVLNLNLKFKHTLKINLVQNFCFQLIEKYISRFVLQSITLFQKKIESITSFVDLKLSDKKS